MSNYTQSIDFSAKDALASGNPAKQVLGADIDTELGLIATAITSKLDTPSTAAAKAAIALPGASGFYATPTAAQTAIPTGSAITLTFGTEVYDYGGEFAANAFSPTATGIYMLSASITTSTAITSGLFCMTWFSKSGTPLAGSKVTNGATTTVIQNISWVGQLTVGDSVTVLLRHNQGSNIDLDIAGSFSRMYFSGHRIA